MPAPTLTTKLKAAALIVGAVVYCLSPLDVVPDIIPLAGWADDAAVIAYVQQKVKEWLSGGYRN